MSYCENCGRIAKPGFKFCSARCLMDWNKKVKEYMELKAKIKSGELAYGHITDFQRDGKISKGQALALRRLWNKQWQKEKSE